MKMEFGVSAENDVQLAGGDFQLAELEQRLEMVSVGPEGFYYCCMCFNNINC